MKQYIDSILDPEITLKKGKEMKGILLIERNSFECFQGYFYISLQGWGFKTGFET